SAGRYGGGGPGAEAAPGQRLRDGRGLAARPEHSHPPRPPHGRCPRPRSPAQTKIPTMSEPITPGLVDLAVSLGTTAHDVITHLANQITAQGRATDAAELAEHALAREAKTATGVPGGIAIPHCRSAAVTAPTLAMARLADPVDFGAKDGPADLV